MAHPRPEPQLLGVNELIMKKKSWRGAAPFLIAAVSLNRSPHRSHDQNLSSFPTPVTFCPAARLHEGSYLLLPRASPITHNRQRQPIPASVYRPQAVSTLHQVADCVKSKQ